MVVELTSRPSREHANRLYQRVGFVAARPTFTASNSKNGATRVTDGAAYALGGLHHVQLAIPAGGEDDCRRFWAEILGLTELAKPPVLASRGGCWFRGGGLEVHLGVESDFAPARKAHPGILVHQLDGLARRLQRYDVSVAWDDEFPGHRRFYASDPFGNRLEFLEPFIP